MKKVLVMAAVCLMAAMTFAAQCAAMTKKGTQCKRQASPGSEFCWQHGGTTKAERAGNGESEAPKRSRKAAKAETEAPTEPAANDAPAVAEGQCQATTRRGTPCKRKAQAGGKYCAQHAAKMGGGEADALAAKPKRTRKAKSEAEAPAANDAPAVAEGQCHATTKSGAPCKRKAQAGGKYCAQHAAKMGGGEAEAPAARPKRTRKAKSEAAAPSEAKAEPAAGGMCQGKLKNGEPCKRKAKPGSNFCWQHEK